MNFFYSTIMPPKEASHTVIALKPCNQARSSSFLEYSRIIQFTVRQDVDWRKCN